jgi:hypothetical protein
VRAKILIALWGSIPADDVNLSVRTTDGLGGVGQNVEKPWIIVMHLSGAVVAEKMVQLRQSLGNISIAVAVHDVQVLTSMSMVKPKVALPYRGGAAEKSAGENGDQDYKTGAHNVYLWTLNFAPPRRTFL